MKEFSGIIIEKGTVLGPVFLLKKEYNISNTKNLLEKDVYSELEKLDRVIDKSKQQIKEIINNADKKLGKDFTDIFQIHYMILEDETFIEPIKNKIRANYGIIEAINENYKDFKLIFKDLDDDYLSNRINDIKDISSRLITNLSSQNEDKILNSPHIIVTDELTPSDILMFDKDNVLGFVSSKGAVNSHAAILARNMEIPTIFSVKNIANSVNDEDIIIIDSENSKLILNPDEKSIDNIKKIITKEKENLDKFQQVSGLSDTTKDGRELKLFANISSSEDINSTIIKEAAGIGLFRTEFLFMDRNFAPSEEEQFLEYKKVAIALKDKPVIIRTIDLGADKCVEYINRDMEYNPALGKRGIRISLEHLDLFKTQLKAIFRASYYGNIYIMYPMITSSREIEMINTQLKIVEAELIEEGEDYSIPPQGIMIETPAAAIISDELASSVDFFSIGTNDLIQYTLACDRYSNSLIDYYDSYHPAILKLIKLTVKNAHDNGIWCGICGDLASDVNLIKCFVDMGVDELSVSSNKILELRYNLKSF